MAPTLKPLPETYSRTISDLHRLAVYAISPAQRLANGEIILRATPGGFSTFEYSGHVAGVDRDRLVVDGAARPITTLRDSARALGIEPDVSQQGQFDVPPHGNLDETLMVDPDAAGVLGAWFAFVTDALDALRADAGPGDDATIVRIWPEHFDAAIDMGDGDAGRRATFGGSPGDGHHAEPYLYVSPWAGRVDPFFDEPSFKGAVLTYAALLDAPDAGRTAAEFLSEARRQATRATLG